MSGFRRNFNLVRNECTFAMKYKSGSELRYKKYANMLRQFVLVQCSRAVHSAGVPAMQSLNICSMNITKKYSTSLIAGCKLRTLKLCGARVLSFNKTNAPALI